MAPDRRVADRVDPAVERVEPALRAAPVDRAVADAEREQLPPRDDAVLPCGELRDDGVTRPGFPCTRPRERGWPYERGETLVGRARGWSTSLVSGRAGEKRGTPGTLAGGA
jgi:hypothetical protein